jgi:hypothetical protein
MSTIVTRSGKGSPLTHTEVDNNFTNLNNDKYQSGNNASFGTLSTSGTTTISALTASQAVFTNGSKNLVSNAITGTGNVVMSASPTLTGTITAADITASGNIIGNGNWTLGNADTDTITVGASFVTGSVLRSAKTATNTLALAAYDVDGAAYTNLITLTASNTPTLALTSTGVGTINNMSVGATTRSTGAFTTLTSNGATTFTAGTASTTTTTGTLVVTGGVGVSGQVTAATLSGNHSGGSGAFTTLSATGVTTVQAGTVSAPAITTSGDTNTGIFFPAADTIAFTEGGTEAMRINSSGNVGIGTSSPSYKLDINGGSVGSTTGNRADTLSLVTSTSNGDFLNFYKIRTSTGSNWETAAWRLQQKIDATDMGYIQFNGTGNNFGISFGTVNTELSRIAANGQQSSVVPDGSVLYPEYKCRAWVNFNGTGTVAIRASGNVSSITDNGTGDFTVNFTNAMPDANYATTVTCASDADGFLLLPAVNSRSGASSNPTTTAQRIFTRVSGQNTDRDSTYINVAVHR